MSGVSVVVVTWNSEMEIGPLLASIARHLPAPYEVIVVDNASTDDTVTVAESWDGPGTVTRLPENRGFGAANNVGVRAARYDVVLLLNPDTLLVDDSLVGLARLALETRSLYGPELVFEDGTRQPSASPPPSGWELALEAFVPAAAMPAWLRYRCAPWRSRRIVDAGWLTGACIAAPRDVLLQLGPFDEQIELYSEDMDLGIRAARAGVRSRYAPTVARVVHLGDRSAVQRFADAGLEWSIRNRRLVVRKHYGRLREWYDLVFQIAYHGLRWTAKRAMGRDSSRDEQWLTTVARLMRR